jgi:hypothetical protein
MVRITGGIKNQSKGSFTNVRKKQKNKKKKISFKILDRPKNTHSALVLVAGVFPVN